jgi:heme-degrading monooxygenase HmoA
MVTIHAIPDSEDALICVMTRLRLRNVYSLLRFLRAYRRVSGRARRVPGLVYITLLFGSPLTVYMLSVWQSEESMRRWVGVDEHVMAVRNSPRLASEIWSGRWRLDAISTSAQSWPALRGRDSS